MIPQRKKTAQEIAALRSQLGITEQPSDESPTYQQQPPPTSIPKPAPSQNSSPPPFSETDEPVFRLSLPPIPATNQQIHQTTTPSAPYPTQTHKSQLPTHRRSDAEIAELRRREQLSLLNTNQAPHTHHLKSHIAHPILLILTYLPSIAAPITVWQKYQHLIPISLIAFSTLLTFYIFLAKKPSSHHAAFVIIINIMTIAFGFHNYPQLLHNAP